MNSSSASLSVMNESKIDSSKLNSVLHNSSIDDEEDDAPQARLTMKHFLEMNFEKDSKILVITPYTSGSAHTACEESFAKIFQRNGFNHIDVMIINIIDEQPTTTSKTVEQLKQKQCFRDVMDCSSLGSLISEKKSQSRRYDVVLLSDGILAPNSIDYHLLEKIIQITKSGGFICWLMGPTKLYATSDQSYRDEGFERYIASLCDKCKWLSVLGYPLAIPNYQKNNFSGQFYAMQVV